MTDIRYNPKSTGLLLVDPYNDFLAPEGKVWPRLKDTAESVNLLDHLDEIIQEARKSRINVFFVPHHRWEAGDYSNWKHPNHYQIRSGEYQLCAKGTWGGEFHPRFQPQQGDIIIKEHWAQSGFANTDLDHQLKEHGIEKIIVIGVVANTCVESTARFGMELGYHVTLVSDATAAFSKEAMHVAHEINGPTFAHMILKTCELLEAIKTLY